MKSCKYSVLIEVSAPIAMFARPDTGATPTSYPAPSWSAAKGILESIAFLKSGAVFDPRRVTICRRVGTSGGIRYLPYTTNYGGPLRKGNQRAAGAGFQFFATVLTDVCYRIEADARSTRDERGHNAAHHLQDLFERNPRMGRRHQTPAMDWKEFTCSYGTSPARTP